MTLQLARYRFQLAFDRPAQLPFYTGSMLRGAFGHALRKLACITQQTDCKACPLYRSCPYPRIFEPAPPETHTLQKFSQVPAPYIIEPPGPGMLRGQQHPALTFNMVLLGPALNELPLIIAAWQRALRFGLGQKRSTGIVHSVAMVDEQQQQHPVWHHQGEPIAVLDTPSPPLKPNLGDKVRLHLHTPLRIQKRSKPLGARELNARDILITLSRRLALLTDFHSQDEHNLDFQALTQHAEAITLEPEQLHWCDWERYSHRQQQAMKLGGVMGTLTLQGNLAPFNQALHLGQWLHMGKNATFGMGGYTLEQRP